LKSLVDAGEIGEPQSLIASFGLAEAPGGDNPLFDPARGGGALLDRGVYLLSLAQHVLGAPSSITAKARTSVTGVDEHTALTLTYPNGAIASLIASLTADLPNRFLISGTAGAIELDAPIFRPSRLTLSQTEPRTYAAGAAAGGKAAALKESPLVHQLHQRLAPALKLKPQTGTSRLLKAYQGNGYHHQAAEVMRAVAASELESPIMPLEESLAVLDAVDAARQSD
ncbi:MAG: Gfo/Idh/MocA family oxidoreductase, partial [Pseudomonadota bacterium]